ncbi:MAG: DMT family transporter [Bacteroidetes bacterium]|nr:DMT family transporter [Bacteroidota bacterium]
MVSEQVQVIGFSLLVNSLYFLADLFIKLSSLQSGPFRLIFFRSLFAVALCIPLFLLSAEPLQLEPGLPLLELIGCALLNAGGLYAYIRALKDCHFVNISVIQITSAFVHYGLALLLQNQYPGFWFYLATLFCVAGIVIQWKKGKTHSGLLWAIGSAILWGFGYGLMSVPLQSINSSTGTLVAEFVLLMVSALFMRSETAFKFEMKQVLFLFSIGFFTIAGSYFLYISYARFNLNLMGFMQLAFFPYSLLAGRLVFKERLTKVEWQGIALVLAGLLVYFFSS